MTQATVYSLWIATLVMALLKSIDAIAWSWWIIMSPFIVVIALNIGWPILIGLYRGMLIRRRAG